MRNGAREGLRLEHGIRNRSRRTGNHGCGRGRVTPLTQWATRDDESTRHEKKAHGREYEAFARWQAACSEFADCDQLFDWERENYG